MQKLAELIKARRNINLAEKRKSKENTLALVRQYAQEARATAAQPSQEKVRKMHGGYYGDEDNMEEDDDVIIPDGLQSEDPEALNNSEVPPFMFDHIIEFQTIKINIIHSLKNELLNQQ